MRNRGRGRLLAVWIGSALPLAAQSGARLPGSSQLPLPLTRGRQMIALWPAGSPTLKGADRKEIFTMASGGGNRELNVGTEGTDVAAWLNDLGISAFVLRFTISTVTAATR